MSTFFEEFSITMFTILAMNMYSVFSLLLAPEHLTVTFLDSTTLIWSVQLSIHQWA